MPSSFRNSSAIRSRDSAIRSLARVRAGIERRGVGLARAEAGVEAEEAQDAQMILGDALQRIADEAHAALLEVVEPAEIIEDLAGQRDRRTSALIVKSRRAASSRQSSVKATVARRPSVDDVAAQGRDLERMAVADRGDRAMLDARSAPP